MLIVLGILAMIIVTVLSQTDLLQTRVKQGIGSPVDQENVLP